MSRHTEQRATQTTGERCQRVARRLAVAAALQTIVWTIASCIDGWSWAGIVLCMVMGSVSLLTCVALTALANGEFIPRSEVAERAAYRRTARGDNHV